MSVRNDNPREPSLGEFVRVLLAEPFFWLGLLFVIAAIYAGW